MSCNVATPVGTSNRREYPITANHKQQWDKIQNRGFVAAARKYFLVTYALMTHWDVQRSNVYETLWQDY